MHEPRYLSDFGLTTTPETPSLGEKYQLSDSVMSRCTFKYLSDMFANPYENPYHFWWFTWKKQYLDVDSRSSEATQCSRQWFMYISMTRLCISPSSESSILTEMGSLHWIETTKTLLFVE